ncbi:hypothetical protein [Hyphococcus sp.]|uniref:hypothetical protein n=1 Tax=Hyphococcus sp. TaxID=2038636 RepID=UPI0035C722B1
MKYTGMLCAIFCAVFKMSAAHAQDDRAPQSEDVLKQLVFMEGDWALTTYIYHEDGSLAQKSSALMTVKSILGGKGYVEERKFNIDDPKRFYAAATLFSVKPQTDQLVGALNNTLGNRKLLNQVMDSDGLVFEMRGELFQGAPGYARLTYKNITEDSFEFVQDYCPEDGNSCQERTFAFTATRRQ